MIKNLLAELDDVVPDYEENSLRPGASDSDLDRVSRKFMPYAFPGELRELYSWHNGSSTSFFPKVPLFGFHFLSLDEGVEMVRVLGEGQYGNSWAKQFFPIGNMNGELMLATMSNLSSERAQAYQYVVEDDEACLMHQDLGCMIKTAQFVWTETAEPGQSVDEIRLRYSPGAYTEAQKGSKNVFGCKNIFEFSSSLPDRLV